MNGYGEWPEGPYVAEIVGIKRIRRERHEFWRLKLQIVGTDASFYYTLSQTDHPYGQLVAQSMLGEWENAANLWGRRYLIMLTSVEYMVRWQPSWITRVAEVLAEVFDD